jgi:hypothetical protein
VNAPSGPVIANALERVSMARPAGSARISTSAIGAPLASVARPSIVASRAGASPIAIVSWRVIATSPSRRAQPRALPRVASSTASSAAWNVKWPSRSVVHSVCGLSIACSPVGVPSRRTRALGTGRARPSTTVPR